MTQKIIFFDIDGTLVDNVGKPMPESAKEAIRQAQANGHICVINTGRTQALMGREIMEQLEFDGYLMGCGTMVVYHGKELLHHTFTEEETLRIMEGLERHEIDVLFEGTEAIFGKPVEEFRYAAFRNYVGRMEGFSYCAWELAPGRFDKFYAYVDDVANMDAFAEEFGDFLDFIDRERGFFEVVPKGYSKASAISELAKKLHIPMEDTVAIGDSNNDIPMLQCAGISIGMGNSTQNVLNMVDYVTTDVDKDGIRNALKWLGVLKA